MAEAIATCQRQRGKRLKAPVTETNAFDTVGSSSPTPASAMPQDRDRKRKAILGSTVFLALAPGIVAGVLPALITGWDADDELPGILRAAGAGLGLLGLAFLLHAFARFALEGLGTPAPVAPTERLVVGGAYRFVRNPMYLAVLAVIAGQALFFGDAAVGAYGAVVALAFMAFVRIYEEPTLRATYGAEYDAYCDEVPRWLPRPRRRCGRNARE
jgi:protein-S-isoprenylcysteine O-methyltransferase Ste14